MALTKVSFSMIKGAYFNVLDYGAVGNGTTEDTTAFDLAIAAATVSGGTVFVPSGTYYVDRIDMSSDVALVG
jgi:polygalacturonase